MKRILLLVASAALLISVTGCLYNYEGTQGNITRREAGICGIPNSTIYGYHGLIPLYVDTQRTDNGK